MLDALVKRVNLPEFILFRSTLVRGVLPVSTITLLAIALVGCGGGGGGGAVAVAVVDNGSGDPIVDDPVELTFEATMPASLFIEGEKYISIAETYELDFTPGLYEFSNPILSNAAVYVYQHMSPQSVAAYPKGLWLLVKADQLTEDDFSALQSINDNLSLSDLVKDGEVVSAEIQQAQLDEEEQAFFMSELEWALSTKVNGDVDLTSSDLASADDDLWDADVQALFAGEERIDYFISNGDFDDLPHSLEEIQFIQAFFTSLDALIDLDFRQTEIFEEAEIGFYRYDVLYEDEEDFTIAETYFLENYDQLAIDWIRLEEGVVLEGYDDLASNDASTIGHETGHALGLEHPRLDGYDLNFDQDDTLMSYNNAFFGWAYDFSAVDLARLVELWGEENDLG